MKNKIEVIANERGYIVSEQGLLYNPKGIKIADVINTNGYYYTNIRVNNKPKKLLVHRLQAYQKYGIKLYESNTETRHFNSNRLDNSYTNILIGTHQENMLDKPKIQRINTAILASRSLVKYNHEEVINFYTKIKSYKATMLQFNISSKGTLSYILNKIKNN